MQELRRALVVLGTRDDPHVSRVENEVLNLKNTEVFVVDYLGKTRFDIKMNETGDVECQIDGTTLPENYIVWDRNKIIEGSRLYVAGGDEESKGYAAKEWRALFNLICGLNAGRVVNDLMARCCMIKPYQQLMAAKVGFMVPKTLVTNDRSSAITFQREAKIIMKSLSGGKVKPADGSPPYNVMTMRVDLADLESASDESVAYCPHFFQNEVNKEYEIRVVVVGDSIFAFRIESQRHKLSEVDWRYGVGLVGFIPCKLSDSTEKMIMEFMRGMGLFTGSLDLISDIFGRTWFLECNQDGQWGWLDDILSGSISKAFANEFVRKLDQVDRTRRASPMLG